MLDINKLFNILKIIIPKHTKTQVFLCTQNLTIYYFSTILSIQNKKTKKDSNYVNQADRSKNLSNT